MELQPELKKMLGLLVRPVFLVKNNRIVHTNEAASRLFLREGISVSALLEAGAEDYSQFSSGMLYVTLAICDQSWGASVVRIGDTDVFTLDQQFESEELRILALAARDLRGPLASVLLASQQLRTTGDSSDSLRHLSHGLNQMLRIISNMSDASGKSPIFHTETRFIDSLFRECIEKVSALAQSNGICVVYSGLDSDKMCSVDWQLLERAAMNMLSNAIKFSPPGSTILVQLHNVGKMLRFSVTDHGSGIPEEVSGTVFQRYLRNPGIEDSRHGIGLGMLLIRNAAARHSGAVLIDQPNAGETRVSFTFSSTLPCGNTLHSNRLSIDYAGEMDHALLELSDCLPFELY